MKYGAKTADINTKNINIKPKVKSYDTIREEVANKWNEEEIIIKAKEIIDNLINENSLNRMDKISTKYNLKINSLKININNNDLPKDFYETYLEKINEVSAADVKRVANKYFNYPNGTRIIVVG